MKNVVYNREVIAFPIKEASACSSVYVEPFETFGTEYGLFIPTTLSGYQFIRWVRRGMTDELPRNSIMSHFLHVSNDGEVLLVLVDTEEDEITSALYCSKKFSLLNSNRDITEAFTALLAECETIAQAVAIVDSGNLEGIYKPHILFVNDWVEYAKKMGYNKLLYNTRISS